MTRRKRTGKGLNKLVSERISYLHMLALSSARTRSVYSARYIEMMEKVAMRMDYTVSAGIKRSYCRECKNPYGPDVRIRLKNNIVTVTCDKCGNVRRIPY